MEALPKPADGKWELKRKTTGKKFIDNWGAIDVKIRGEPVIPGIMLWRQYALDINRRLKP